MSQLLLPDARFRSPTAVENRSDMRDDNIYSSLVVGYGGAGIQKAFTVPQGQNIPRLVGSGIAPTSAHLLTHSELTTNLSKAGEAGSSIGDFSVRAVTIGLEQGYYDGAGALNTYGCGQQEVIEVLGKTFFQLKIAGKKQLEGPTQFFPTMGGASGGISTTENAVTTSLVTNGNPGMMRRLKIPILVARNDTIEGVFGVASSDSLVFSVASGVGQCSLVWFNLLSLVKGDVR